MALIDEIISGKQLLKLDVPEWDRPVYYYPFTLADADYASKMSKGKDGEFVAYTIIRKCLDEDGKKLFTIGDKIKLMNNVDPDILSRLVIEMKGGDDDEDNEEKKD